MYKYELRTRTTQHEIAVLRINAAFKTIEDYFILYKKGYVEIPLHFHSQSQKINKYYKFKTLKVLLNLNRSFTSI